MFMSLRVRSRRTESFDAILYENKVTRHFTIIYAIVNNIRMTATLISVTLVTLL